MTDITKEPYAKWLEEILSDMADNHPSKIGLSLLQSDGNVATAYWNCTPDDKAMLSHNMYVDCIFDIMKANAKQIIEACDDNE